MERDLEDIVNECKEFMRLKKQHKQTKYPSAGVPAYLISTKWLQKYKKYILHADIKNNQKPTLSSTHCQETYPGPISNDEDLCEQNDKNLKGTGKDEQFESNCVDKYLKPDVKEGYSFKIYSQQLWDFIYSKYQGSEIKRYYVQLGTFYTQVDLHLKQVPVIILPADNLLSGQISETLVKDWKVQLSKRKAYSDLKKRIVDCLNNLGYQNIQEGQVRLWKFSDVKEKLYDACKNVSENDKNGSSLQQNGDNKDPDLEVNSGIPFPGESIEPILKSAATLEDDTLDESWLVVEVTPSADSQFAFSFKKNQRVFIGKCEFCSQKKILRVECECKRVRYCNHKCLEKDKRWHLDKCSAQADAELQSTQFSKSASARDGKVGLTNLGNTCYMNSSLQCLSNTWELTKYFLDERFKNDLNLENPLGTQGRLVQAYAKLLNEMWYQDDPVVRPTMFKRILGEYAQQFQGYGQHDSHECINTILDLLSEDLYRKQKKPYVEMNEAAGKPDEVAAQESWEKHLLRNDSIIVDLFHGQYKSTLVCSICNRVSITFDPFMTLSLPIPGKKDKISFFYIPYNMSAKDYTNLKGEAFLRETDSIHDFRMQVAEKFEINPSDFIITTVLDNNIKRMLDVNSRVEELINGGTVLIYQINPNLNPQLPQLDQISKTDSNYGVSDQWTKQVLYMLQVQRSQFSNYSMNKHNNIPRIMWVNKNWTLKQLHMEIFSFFKHIFNLWYQFHDDPEHKGTSKHLHAPPFKKPSIDEKDESDLSYEEFKKMDLNEQFSTVFSNLTEENWKQLLAKEDFDVAEMPYALKLKNITGYMEPCLFCGDKRCDGCPVPFTESMKYKDLLDNVGVDTNSSFYTDNHHRRGRNEVIIEVVWSRFVNKVLFESIQNAKQHSSLKNQKEEAKDGQITLADCLEESKKSEMLDEHNKWYCSKCKDHVQATKSLEIYRAPPLLVISLKRFKAGKSKHSMYSGGGGGKLQTVVDFPIQGLDLSPFVLSYEEGKPIIYDLFGVSNHFGSLGFGHYTAYAMNWREGQWYSFDDSSCSKVGNPQRVVTEAAYNLFYRKRGAIDLNNINYDAIRLAPPTQGKDNN